MRMYVRLTVLCPLCPYTTLFRSLSADLRQQIDAVDGSGNTHSLAFRFLHAHHRGLAERPPSRPDRKSTRLNSSHANISYAVFCLRKKNMTQQMTCNKLVSTLSIM